jgi:hypothetical protein
MKLSLLMRHFETKHGDLNHKPLEYFQRKLSDLSASKGQIMSFSGVNMKAVDTSYKVKEQIKQEKLIQSESPYCYQQCQFCFGTESSKKLE